MKIIGVSHHQNVGMGQGAACVSPPTSVHRLQFVRYVKEANGGETRAAPCITA